jgi:PAS domain S-box-containing protein
MSPRITSSDSLQRARTRMDQALAATEDAFLVLEADGTIATANAALNVIFPAPGPDWQVGSAFQDNWQAYLAAVADFPGRVTRLLQQADLEALAQVPGGFELDLPDERSVLARAGRLDDGGLVLSATDVTPMKSAHHLLAQRLAAIEAAPDGIAVSDDAGRLLYLNSAAAQLMGYRGASSALGRIWWHQYRNRMELSQLSPFEPTIAQLDDGPGSQHEVTNSPLEKGGFVIVIRDVTEKLITAAREEELTRQLNRLQRQEAIAQITAGVAHDFNNYLAAINGSATLIDQELFLPDGVREHVRRIASAGAQSARLIARLLDIGAGVDQASRFELKDVLDELPQMVVPLIKTSVAVKVQQPEQQMALTGEQDALTQVMINLILNALEALGGPKGIIAVSAQPALGAAATPVAVGQLRSGASYARIDVTDTGRGMAADTVARVFEPYFTTKGRQGNGLGMAMVAAQLKAVGGAIAVISAPGQGTTVRLFWPLADAAPADAEAAPAAPRVDLSGMTLIVVDDDPLVGEVTANYLESQGAEASHCLDPRDALEIVEEAPEALSALVTDYDMPQMNGGALVERVRKVAPDMPIIVLTALARRLNDPRLVNGQVSAILAKPPDMGALGAALEAARTTMQRKD